MMDSRDIIYGTLQVFLQGEEMQLWRECRRRQIHGACRL
jgi:hypothetical protein